MLAGTDTDIHRSKAKWSGVRNYVIATLKLLGLTHKMVRASSCFNWVSSYPGTGAATQCSASKGSFSPLAEKLFLMG